VNSGKTLFAQLMDLLPWSTFTRIVARYGGDQRVRTLSCGEHYRAMAMWARNASPRPVSRQCFRYGPGKKKTGSDRRSRSLLFEPILTQLP
jgi:hypothetical protein